TDVVDPSGNVTHYDYDPDTLRLRSIVYADGFTEQMDPQEGMLFPGYGTAGNPMPIKYVPGTELPDFAGTPAQYTRSVDAEGNTTITITNRFGQPSQKTNPLGQVTKYERDTDGMVTKMTEPDPDGQGSLTERVTHYTYDDTHNRTSASYPDGSSESWAYDAYSQVTSHTDQLSHVTKFTYDDFGNVATRRQVVGLADDESSEHDDLV